MQSCNHIQFKQIGNTDIADVKICDNPLECICCSFFLSQLKEMEVEDLIQNLNYLPKKITQIKIPIYPLPQNLPIYSFDGIELIILRFFQNLKFLKTRRKNTTNAYLKIFYESNSFFKFPVLNIEILFFRLLSDKEYSEITKTLNETIFPLIGALGKIDEVKSGDKEHLYQLLRIPLLFGQQNLLQSEILLSNGFNTDQIKELNYIHTLKVQQIPIAELQKNHHLQIFKKLREILLA